MLFIFILFMVMFFKPKYFILLFVLHILFCAGNSAREIRHDAYEAFDRVPLENKMHSPKYQHILELVQREKPELTPEQQLKYANSLARSEFGQDALYNTYSALAIAIDVVTNKGGVPTVMFILFVLIGAVKKLRAKRAEKKNTDNVVSDTQQNIAPNAEVSVGDNNAVNKKSEQIQSSNNDKVGQNSLTKEEKEVLTKAQDVIGIYLGRSDNLTDTIKDIDNWLDRQQDLIDNDVYDKEEQAIYDDVLRLRQNLENRVKNNLNKATDTTVQDNVQTTEQENIQTNAQENAQTDTQTDEQNKQAENVVEEFNDVEELVAPTVVENATVENAKQETDAQNTVVDKGVRKK